MSREQLLPRGAAPATFPLARQSYWLERDASNYAVDMQEFEENVAQLTLLTGLCDIEVGNNITGNYTADHV